MLLILLSWLYILFTTVNLGFLLVKTARLKVTDFAVTAILGLFAATIFGSFWAIFGRISWEFHLLLLAINGLTIGFFRKDISGIFTDLKHRIRGLANGLQVFFGISILLIIAQCASKPYLPDNESYYIQTIKWINEYGFVKGIANLHIFLAQTSGWHVTQSVFNFSFVYGKFNDLSGFCLLLGNLFAVFRLDAFFKNGNRDDLVIGFLPLANVLLFQFISTPSPDIPLYVLSFMVFSYFLEDYKNRNAAHFNLIVLLVLFVLYCKPTAAALILVPLVVFVRNFKMLWPKLLVPGIFAFIVFGLFVTKNTIASGYPLYPMAGFTNILNLDYRLPEEMWRFYYQETRSCAFYLDSVQFADASPSDLFKTWILLPKLHGLFNKLQLLLLIVCPFLIWRFANKKEYWLLYGMMGFQLILLFLSSPQYRFFLNFVLLFSFFCLGMLISKRQTIHVFLLLSLLPTAFFLFVPTNINALTNNKLLIKTNAFSVQNFIFPHGNSKSEVPFETVITGNLKFHSPVGDPFFWSCGDGPIPCVNKAQVEYFDYYFDVKPQLRGKSPGDGFYSKHTAAEK